MNQIKVIIYRTLNWLFFITIPIVIIFCYFVLNPGILKKVLNDLEKSERNAYFLSYSEKYYDIFVDWERDTIRDDIKYIEHELEQFLQSMPETGWHHELNELKANTIRDLIKIKLSNQDYEEAHKLIHHWQNISNRNFERILYKELIHALEFPNKSRALKRLDSLQLVFGDFKSPIKNLILNLSDRDNPSVHCKMVDFNLEYKPKFKLIQMSDDPFKPWHNKWQNEENDLNKTQYVASFSGIHENPYLTLSFRAIDRKLVVKNLEIVKIGSNRKTMFDTEYLHHNYEIYFNENNDFFVNGIQNRLTWELPSNIVSKDKIQWKISCKLYHPVLSLLPN